MNTPSKSRSWLDLDVAELRGILETGVVPENIDWNSLPEHPAFDKLFRVRDNPKKIAKILLEASGVERPTAVRMHSTKYIPALSQEYRQERLNVKKEELALQRAKLKNQTVLFEKVLQLETDIHTIKKTLKTILEVLREKSSSSRREAASSRG
jgi:hypothetical protein